MTLCAMQQHCLQTQSLVISLQTLLPHACICGRSRINKMMKSIDIVQCMTQIDHCTDLLSTSGRSTIRISRRVDMCVRVQPTFVVPVARFQCYLGTKMDFVPNVLTKYQHHFGTWSQPTKLSVISYEFNVTPDCLN